MSYLSACVAGCAGVKVAHRGYCGSGPGLPHFSGPRSSGRKERQQVVTRDVMLRYRDAGFSYLGRVKLADAPSLARSPNATLEAGARAKPADGAGGERRHAAAGGSQQEQRRHKKEPRQLRQQFAVRYTPAGDVYYAPLEALSSTGGAAATTRLPAAPPPHEVGPPAAGRGLKMIIGDDERGPCGQPPRFPLTAVGQLDFVSQGQDFICTGALVRRDRVLTAAHCVWSTSERAFVRGVGFAAGRYRTPSGLVVSPFGTQKWRHVTLVSDFPGLDRLGSDMAIVQLETEVSPEAGTMGVDAACATEGPMVMQTAGYASDRMNGECVTESCTVSLACGSEATPHTCDTYMGQSGSPFWDANNMVRGVHVRGLATYNEFSNVNELALRSILAR